jgi:[glutamine synthetase] adenylyltransferase / [glutamine synthetase]-adenylyl-L-tyrosine phosphorylase
MSSTVFEHTPILVTAQQLSDGEARGLLAPVGFADWRAAVRLLRHLAADAGSRAGLAACLPDLLQALSAAGNPDHALSAFERFAGAHADRPTLYRTLASQPRTIETLIAVFAGSQFLTEILFRRPEHFTEGLIDFRKLVEQKTEARFDAEAAVAFAAEAASNGSAEPLDALRRFQQRELLRIGTCDLLGLFDMPTVATQLSHLADSVIRGCLTVAEAEAGVSTDGFVVLAMGKLGGEELNYSSDVDLLFIAILEPTAYRRLAERLIDALSRASDEGFLYRVDMRLRPWGSSGALVSSLDGHIGYLAKHARLW